MGQVRRTSSVVQETTPMELPSKGRKQSFEGPERIPCTRSTGTAGYGCGTCT